MNLEELKKLAMAATPGPWFAEDYFVGSREGVHDIIAGVGGNYSEARYQATATFIAAANPTTVLELIERIAELESEYKRLKSVITNNDRIIDGLTSHVDSMRAQLKYLYPERDALKAEREELMKQEPYRWCLDHFALGVGATIFDTEEAAIDFSRHLAGSSKATPLYASPMPAQPSPAVAVPDGWKLVPVNPSCAQIRAMSESRAVDDEGQFPPMLDILDFSGENKTHTVLKAAYAAMLSAAPTPPSAELTLIGHWSMDFRGHSVRLIDGVMKGSFTDGTPIYAGRIAEREVKA